MRRSLLLSAFVVAFAAMLPLGAQAGSVLPTPPGLVNTDMPSGQDNPNGAQQTARSSGVFLQGSGPINLMPGAYVGHDMTVQTQQNGGRSATSPSAASVYNKSIAAERARQQGQSSGTSPFPPGWAPAIN